MSILLFTIATGAAYREYAIDMFASAHEHWPEADRLVFTDFPQQMQAHVRSIHTDPKGYPGETLMRYHTMLKAEHVLRQWDHIFYADADMLWVAHPEDITSYGIVATLHPGFIGTRGSPETRPESWAFCPHNTAYYCGGFQGGKTDEYLAAVKTMAERIDGDQKKGIMAKWHDESHFNRYLADNKPSKVLTPSYCYPEGYSNQWGWKVEEYKPILLALDKKKRGNHPRFK